MKNDATGPSCSFCILTFLLLPPSLYCSINKYTTMVIQMNNDRHIQMQTIYNHSKADLLCPILFLHTSGQRYKKHLLRDHHHLDHRKPALILDQHPHLTTISHNNNNKLPWCHL
ncbi:hypothetical protein BC941DRAFT_42919 [Chlamydoabsidia padenii]|nr:hypothetical protein BC941DRAFT_42919 [Chlamydoabsidia padenii]